MCNPFADCDIAKNAKTISLLGVASEEELALELCQLSGNLELEGFIKRTSFHDFWIRACSPECPRLSDAFSRILVMFGSTYVCEQLFSGMKSVKSKERSLLSDRHLLDILRISCTSYKLDIEKVTSKLQQQSSH